MSKWVEAEITKVKKWTTKLFTIYVKANVNTFIPGQFAKLSIIKNGKRIQRAYSYVNPPKREELEFYISNISEGILSPVLYCLKPLEKIFINKESFGFFTLKNIKSCKTLWMMSTGTGIGPYLSMLQQNDNQELEKFHNIVLVHAVRYFNDLSYFNLIKKLKKKYQGKLIFKSIVSRECDKNSLIGRIPNLLENKKLEKSIGIKISKKSSHIMLCGNPNMVRETFQIGRAHV